MNSPDWGCSPALFFYPTLKTSLQAFSAYELRIIFPRTNAGIRCSYFSCKARWGEDSILNTSARIAGKALALGGVEGIHRLDKPDRADRDHVILCAVPGIVFFADMRDEPQIVADQRIPRLCGGCPPFADRQRPLRSLSGGSGRGKDPLSRCSARYRICPAAACKNKPKMPSIHTTSRKCMPGMEILFCFLDGERRVGGAGSPCRRRFGAVQRRGARRRGRPHGR